MTIVRKQPQMNKKRFSVRLIRMTAAVALAMLVLYLINTLTYAPFIWVFRGLTNLSATQGNVGQWEETISKVKLIGQETIPIPGYPDVDACLFSKRNAEEGQPLVIYIHGGGWCTGNAESVEWYAKLLASNSYVVANLDYALAPEYQYPASTIQLAEAVNYLYACADQYGYNRDCIFIGGNSAGAHLASQLGGIFTDPDYAFGIGIETLVPADSIHGLILYNGVYDFDTVGECNFPFAEKLAWCYTGVKNYTEFDRIDELSTIKHITPGYPSVFITAGDADPLESQTLEFIQVLDDNKIKVHSLLWSGMQTNLWHDYIYEQNTKEAIHAYEETVSFIEENR